MKWLPFVMRQSRGPRNMVTRLPTIIGRFGFTAAKSLRHLDLMLATMDRYHVRPTLPVTAVTAQRHPFIVQALAYRGVEIAAHGYVHNDWAVLSYDDQVKQAKLARERLLELGLQVRGWRCPYSRWNGHTLQALRANAFEYDATPVYTWPALEEEAIPLSATARADYRRFTRLISGRDAHKHLVLPTVIDDIVQIPMSIPQDEDMVDRLHLDGYTMSRVWLRMLNDARSRGALLVMCLHPERASLFSSPLDVVLDEARTQRDVWIATLGEINDWWRKRNAASVALEAYDAGQWLVRLDGDADITASFCQTTITVSSPAVIVSEVRPTIATHKAWPPATLQRLRDAGYLVEPHDGQHAQAVTLDDIAETDMHPDHVVHRVQESQRHLVRIAPWPAGYDSALSITGDIDALTLVDFAMRLKEF